MKVESESEVAQSCPTLSDPMDCSPPGSSVHGIFQARLLECVAIAFYDIYTYMCINGASLIAQSVKNLPANAGDMGSISGQEDPTCCRATNLCATTIEPEL